MIHYAWVAINRKGRLGVGFLDKLLRSGDLSRMSDAIYNDALREFVRLQPDVILRMVTESYEMQHPNSNGPYQLLGRMAVKKILESPGGAEIFHRLLLYSESYLEKAKKRIQPNALSPDLSAALDGVIAALPKEFKESRFEDIPAYPGLGDQYLDMTTAVIFEMRKVAEEIFAKIRSDFSRVPSEGWFPYR